MSSFNVEKYVPTINSILRLSDLSTISAKKIRHALAQEFPNDEIAQNKSILDKRILECFGVIRGEREGSSSEDDRPPPRPSHDLLKSDLLHPSSPAPKRKQPASSPPAAPASKKSRQTPPVPRVKSEKSAKQELYDSDEDARFAAELDQALNSGPTRRTRGAASGTRTKPRKKKVKNGEDGEKKKRAPNPNSAFHAPMLLSPQLADVVFETELSRPAVVKKLWDYIKSNELQNPQKKQEIICDGKLRALFNVDRVHMFTMNKILSNHMWAKSDVVGGDSSTTSKSVAPKISHSPASQPSPKRNGKPVLSSARVRSESESPSEQPEESKENSSDNESRFSDSEDDR